ncbi:MAG TPA: glyoxalase [Mycobacteriales bacterium]|nr:glyoxalase [Mycobacteriales bacterium]
MSGIRGAVGGIHHVQLACAPGGEDAARKFYGVLLGLTEVAKPPGLAGRGGVWFRGNPPGPVEIHIGVEPDFRPARKAHPGLLVTDLDALAARLAHAGHHPDWDGELPGFRRCYVHDSHGNRLELLEPAG